MGKIFSLRFDRRLGGFDRLSYFRVKRIQPVGSRKASGMTVSLSQSVVGTCERDQMLQGMEVGRKLLGRNDVDGYRVRSRWRRVGSGVKARVRMRCSQFVLNGFQRRLKSMKNPYPPLLLSNLPRPFLSSNISRIRRFFLTLVPHVKRKRE